MELLPVEIKVNIEGDVAGALSALGAPQGALMTRRIWFAEDRAGVAQGKVSLLDAGVIVRLRIGGGRDDLVVKLRPCTREQLVGRFSAPFEVEPITYKIEEDWSRNGRVLAASLVHSHPTGVLPAAVEPGADPSALLDAVQDQFLHACARDVHLDGLVTLGPIFSTKVDDVPLDDLEVDLEAWSAVGLDFLEASIRVKPKDGDDAEEFKERAERKLRKLEEAVLERGVTLSGLPDSKTHRVLTALAAAAQG
ncbi:MULTISPECIES: hypothetical protein [unclassified Streptomyces]|uniref:hypothetical protein n=1 Tax=unclassified Streptomyces TaxID=2593676 RepID=UPI000DC7B254|nr:MULTISPECIES: hypothetical protein [unclassified Streptomyces]AWZ04230.1 hypothetical protein DRB89_05850 [Streptomyces sp. ICC4]AWZ11840.1 hypothetical protein DRB96_05385 [Streptomyces sp. ICC1]